MLFVFSDLAPFRIAAVVFLSLNAKASPRAAHEKREPVLS
jgi:hypothetical protein